MLIKYLASQKIHVVLLVAIIIIGKTCIFRKSQYVIIHSGIFQLSRNVSWLYLNIKNVTLRKNKTM